MTIPAGANWESEINARLEEANIILLLVSPDYFASDYAYDVEMKHALNRHSQGKALVLPVILKPVDWKGSPLSELSVLPPGATPINVWKNQDAAWLEVIKGIRAAINALPQSRRTR